MCALVGTEVIGPEKENVPSAPTVFLMSTRRPCWLLVNVHVMVSPALSVIVAVGLAIEVVDWLAPAASSAQLMLFNSQAGVVAGSSSLTV